MPTGRSVLIKINFGGNADAALSIFMKFL